MAPQLEAYQQQELMMSKKQSKPPERLIKREFGASCLDLSGPKCYETLLQRYSHCSVKLPCLVLTSGTYNLVNFPDSWQIMESF